MERPETTEHPTPDELPAPHAAVNGNGAPPPPPGVRTYRVDVEPVGNGSNDAPVDTTAAGETADAEIAAAHAAAAEARHETSGEAAHDETARTGISDDGSSPPVVPTFSDISLTTPAESAVAYVPAQREPVAATDAPLAPDDLSPPGEESAAPLESTDPSDTIGPAEPVTGAGMAEPVEQSSSAAADPAHPAPRPALSTPPSAAEPAAEPSTSETDAALTVAEPTGDPRRREFMKKALAVLAGGAAATIPAAIGLRVFLDPLGRKHPEGGSSTGEAAFIPVTNLAALPDDGRPHQFQVLADKTDAWTVVRNVPVGAVYLIRRGNTVTAFNVVCPHAGCFVDVAPAGSDVTFACPCHRSSFLADGSHTPGSVSPRGLDRLDVDREALAAGEVRVRFQNFQAGTPEKVPVG